MPARRIVNSLILANARCWICWTPENEYFQAKRNYVNTDYDIQTSYARLYAVQGELLSKVGAQRQSLPELNREDHIEAATVCEAIAPAQVTVDKAALLADAKPLSVPNQQMVKQVTKPVRSCIEETITARVNDWAEAWRHKDYDSYSQFYADNFTPEPPLGREAWATQRKQRLSTSGKINLEFSHLKVTCDGDKAAAVFDQDYSVST